MHQSNPFGGRFNTRRSRAVARPLQPRAAPPRADERREAPRRQTFRRRRWTLFTYAFIVAAALGVASVTYTSYAFSRYQGLVLPGVYVDNLPLGNDTWLQAQSAILQRLTAINNIPVALAFDGHVFRPSLRSLRLGYDVNTTVDHAFSIGRMGNFWQNLFDRMPFARHFSIALLYACGRHRSVTATETPQATCAAPARAWVLRTLVPVIRRPAVNAALAIRHEYVVAVPSRDGYAVDVPAAVAAIQARLGSLSIRTDRVPVVVVRPSISDAPAIAIRDRVDRFLSKPPVLVLHHHRVRTSRNLLAGMISFAPVITNRRATIVMKVDTAKLSAYVSTVASRFDIPARNPDLVFSGSQVTVVAQRQVGRAMNQAAAMRLLFAAFKSLKPAQVLRIPVTRVEPSVDVTNPASLGISSLLGEGESSFFGSTATRLTDVQAIAARLNGVLIHPNQEISFNYYAGTGWPTRVYTDTERRVQGQLVPGTGGAMQQAATTFFRAAYSAGLPLLERHAHPFRLSWYEPPIGMDAIVSPNGSDLRFQNDTGGYILVETRVEPIQGAMYIYLYGPKLNWKVDVGKPVVLHTYPSGTQIRQLDPNLPPVPIKPFSLLTPAPMSKSGARSSSPVHTEIPSTPMFLPLTISRGTP